MSGRTVVVGGGLSGLVAAHGLARAGEDVVLLEETDRPGGVVRTESKDGFLLEVGPNTVRPTLPLWQLVDELGLSGEVVLADPRSPRYVDYAGQLHPVPMSPAALLTTPLLSAGGKLRLLTEPLRSRGSDPEESVREFTARRLGAEIADRFIEPFVGGIFAGSATRLCAAAAFPTLARWEREHGSLFAGALADRKARATPTEVRPKGLLSFRDGLGVLPRAIADALGPAIRLSCPVQAIAVRNGSWTVTAAGEDFMADRVILAASAHRASALMSPLAPEAARALAEVPHPPLAVLHLAWPQAALRRPLRGFGHLVVPARDRRILGAVWSSSLFPGRCPEGMILLTVFLGGSRDPAALALSDGQLIDAASRDLAAEGLLQGSPQPVLLTRWARAIPQYERGHLGRMAVLAAAEERLPGLRFLGNYRGGIAVADVVASARAAAEHE